jgi:hypothetical protein
MSEKPTNSIPQKNGYHALLEEISSMKADPLFAFNNNESNEDNDDYEPLFEMAKKHLLEDAKVFISSVKTMVKTLSKLNVNFSNRDVVITSMIAYLEMAMSVNQQKVNSKEKIMTNTGAEKAQKNQQKGETPNVSKSEEKK